MLVPKKNMGSIYIKNILLVLTIFICWVQSYSQSHVYKHYTVEDGLPSSEVYSAFQDSKGYMWFATDAGVSRFNGYEFENFDASDGLTDNTVFLITEDHKGRIWFGTFNCQLSYYENDSIYPYEYNDRLDELLNNKSAMNSFYVDTNENIWMGFKNTGLYKISKYGVVESLISMPNSNKKYSKVCRVDNNTVWGLDYAEDYVEKSRKRKPFVYEFNFEVEFMNEPIEVPLSHNFIRRFEYVPINNFSIEQYQGQFLLFTTHEVSRFKKKGDTLEKNPINIEISALKNRRLFSVLIEDEFLWICVEKKGVYKCKIENDRLVEIDHFLGDKSISRVFKDREDGYWFQSLNEGIYYMSSDDRKYSLLDGRGLTSIEIDTITGQLYAAFKNGEVAKVTFNSNGDDLKMIAKVKIFSPTLKYNYFNNSLLMSDAENLIYYQNKQIYTEKILTELVKSFIVDSNIIYNVNSQGLSIIENKVETYNSYRKGESNIWGTSLIKNKDKIWIGTKDGIRVYNDRKITNPFQGNKFLMTAITSMERLDKDLFLIGTKSYGMLIIKNDSVIDIINKENGLAGNIVRTIHVDNQQTIWVGTSTGISRVNYENVDNFKVYNLTKKHGIPSGEIIDLCSYKNTIYAATASGLLFFDKTKIKPNINPPQLYISKFLVNAEVRKSKKEMVLSYKENFINIQFEALNYRSLGEVEYQYRMLGVDTNWITTTTRLVQYPTLQPNDYKFEVKAKNEDGFWSDPTTISFTINSPFWNTWWFIVLEILFGIIVLLGVFRYREKQIRKTTTIEKKMVELELKALRSQMNPHFIFNTLNSIQHYIAVNDFKNSNKYIAKFAKLIRNILHLSEKNAITIQEEIDILIMYMDLEKMRFDEQFDYKIEISNKIDKDYDEIPSMLLQPYVENAIWHGLMNKGKKGVIKIKIQLEDDFLCCSVEDNGIGRKKSAEIKAKRNIKQKSVGMSITKERLDIISNHKVNVETIDLIDEHGRALGTRIMIRIPYVN